MEYSIPPYRRLLRRAFAHLRGGSLTVEYPNRARETFGEGEPRVGLKIRRAGVVPRLLLDPELAFGEAVMRGDLEIEGRLEDLISLVQANTSTHSALVPRAVEKAFEGAAVFSRWRPLRMSQNRRDVSRHYDLGNEFYARWLDPTMTYSCAYFRSLDDSLETAQRNKIRHVLKKLQLQRGETLLDIGCGWGAVVSEAARNFGAHALGITLSDEQLPWFNARNEKQSTPGAQVSLQHYHALAESGMQFDKIVSIGMAEHVGRHRLRGYIEDVKKLLKPGGLGLIHCITGTLEEPTNPWLVKYIFPGGYIPSFREMVNEISTQQLVILDVENIGQHYALTLDKWLENFERETTWIEARYGKEFVRMWRLYLQFSAASFRVEDTYVHQILFSNGHPHNQPLTREHLYA